MATSQPPAAPASAERLSEKWTPDARDARIRDKAYEIWLEEGRPSWQDERHWAMASELIDAEDGNIERGETTMPRDDDAAAGAANKATDLDIADLAKRHGVSEDAVRTVLDAVRRGGGTMAQFSHPDFGGMAQWTLGGMTMVGDMFNDRLKARLNELASELAGGLARHPGGGGTAAAGTAAAGTTSGHNWWPKDLGQPGSAGAQNQMRYAIFPAERRLVIDDHGAISVYDTGDHRISGISQAQSSDQTLAFTSQSGAVRLADLKKVG